MRFANYLLMEMSWIYKEGYAGRGLLQSSQENDVIIWMLLEVPSDLGLLWSLPNGKIFLNNKQIGDVNITDISKITHKKILASMYNELGYNRIEGDLRDNVEEWFERNVRGRIIKNEIYIYDDEQGVSWKNRMRKAQSLIKRYIKSDWYKK